MSGEAAKQGEESSYIGEFGRNWQPMTSAGIGMIAGLISLYINNYFSPHVIAEFGWTKSDFALIGLTSLILMFVLPITGRLTDQQGLRRMALAGVIGMPLVLLGLALQTGSFMLFFVLSTFQTIIMTAFLGMVVYARLIVRYFEKARGLALGIASCGPALVAAAVGPALSGFIDAYGWRAGYMLVGGFVLLLGVISLLLVPREFSDRGAAVEKSKRPKHELSNQLASRPFIVIFAAMLLVNLQFSVQTTQLALILTEIGSSATVIPLLISAFAMGVILGRILCGLALDRFEPRRVATGCFLFPAIALALLAMGTPSLLFVGFAVVSLGFSVGAEGDLAAYLTARYFKREYFSSILGLFLAAMAIATFSGAVINSRLLAISGSYSWFLTLASICTFLGAMLFLMLGKKQTVAEEAGLVTSA